MILNALHELRRDVQDVFNSMSCNSSIGEGNVDSVAFFACFRFVIKTLEFEMQSKKS